MYLIENWILPLWSATSPRLTLDGVPLLRRARRFPITPLASERSAFGRTHEAVRFHPHRPGTPLPGNRLREPFGRRVDILKDFASGIVRVIRPHPSSSVAALVPYLALDIIPDVALQFTSTWRGAMRCNIYNVAQKSFTITADPCSQYDEYELRATLEMEWYVLL